MASFIMVYVLPPPILLFGLVGNTLGYIILGRKNLDKIGPVLIYKSLFVIDTLNLVMLLVTNYMQSAFNYDITSISGLGCKIYYCFNGELNALSGWCLVYISVEKFIAIAFTAKRHIFKAKKNQIIYLIILLVFNVIYHINVPFSLDIVTDPYNDTYCNFINNEWSQIISYMDMTNFSFVPTILMFCFSSLLIGAIFKARRRVRLNNSEREMKRFRQDIRFSINLILMNLFYFILTLPNIMALFFYFDGDLLYLAIYLNDISYCINFYLLTITNSLVRSEFFSLFRNRQNETPRRRVNNQSNRQNIVATSRQAVLANTSRPGMKST